MPGNHSEDVATSGFLGFSPTRSRLAIAAVAVVAVIIGLTVWTLTSSSDDAVRPSLIVIPTTALSGPPPGVITADPYVEPTPSAVPPTSAKPSPTPAREAVAGLGARYVLGSSWNDGFVSNLVIGNDTGASTGWQVRLTYPANVEIAVTGFWNATASVSGTTLVLDGGPLAADAEVQAGFQATKNTPAQVDPTSCTINGTPCAGF
ncbi:cellulose binding domain-containing protein [Catenuloplanes japonicus]|uniref:cellulose binding domain-containing protein n=1 Tax=Catenuloplanes japonicus TaxID=33876 RepID=UPI0005248F95|nr:cellulose binding domain-containing protein [Catenuloplanes japonicus]